MPYEPSNSTDARSWARRLGQVAMVIVIGVAFTGLVVGIRAGKTAGGYSEKPMLPHEASEEITPDPSNEENASDLPIAPTYSQIGQTAKNSNSNWENALENLVDSRPDLFAPVNTDQHLKMQSLQDREQLRAYNGAPPVIPHPIEQRNAANCLACHETGFAAGGRVAKPLPHPAYPNCTQCHVEAESTRFPVASRNPLTESNFNGVPAPTGGRRAWEGAPPTIPHATWMRQNCNACHGVLGDPGLRTSHPWRNNCTQCHSPSASNDQFTTNPLFPTPPAMFSNPEGGDE